MAFTEDDDRPVLDILGLATPAELAPVDPPSEPVRPFSPSRELVSTPLTRRELRERERSDEPAAEAPRPSKAGKAPRGRAPKPVRVKKKITRRDLVRRVGRAKTSGKTIGARLLSFGAMMFAGALALGMSLPANAFGSGADQLPLADSLPMAAQSVQVDPTLVSFSARDAWTVTSWAEMLRLRYGNRSFDYTVGTGPIRWPFPVALPITSGFGDRAAPCRGCSTDHSGLDFMTGYGTAIFSVADGVVVERSEGGSSWGNYVVVESTTPDGQVFQTGFAHMASGSSALQMGEQVKVGDFIGLSGATGQVTGAHLHLTIKIDGSFVDPFTFLRRWAG
ncbi:M23 family metallopeptidase [Pseudolysinimonas sp.]